MRVVGLTSVMLLRREYTNAAGEWNEPATQRGVRPQQQIPAISRPLGLEAATCLSSDPR